MSLIQTPWTSQPQQAVGIDWSNPITRGMSLCVGKERINVISGKAATVIGTKYTAGLKGIASGFGATFGAGATDSITTDLTAHAAYRTYLSVATRNGLGGGSGGRLFEKRTAGAVVEAWYSNAGGSTLDFWKQYSGATALLTVPAPANNKPFALAIAIDSTAPGSYPSCYKDGVKVTVSGSTSSGTPTTNVDAYVIGNRTNDNARNWDGEIYLTVFWDRLLSEAELASVTANPWQIFKPIQRRIFVPVSAVSSDTLLYPTKGSLVTSAYAPTITQPGTDTTLSPAKGSLAITGKTPTLTQPNALSPSKAAAIFSGKQPTISQTANQTLSPSKVSLVFSGKTPTIDQTAANSILPGTGHYYTSGKQPTITQPNSIAPSKRAVAITGYQPTVLQSFSINPTTGAVVITGKTPSITQPNAITPLVAHAILTGKAPIISDSTPMTDSQKLDLIIDILSNKQTLNPTTGIYTLYADDGTTVLMTAQAWEDAAGTIKYRGKALQRLDAMS